MTVNDCINAYTSLSDKAFKKKSHRVAVKGKLQGRFDRAELEWAVKISGKESKKKEIAAATGRYVASQAVFKQMKVCANSSRKKSVV
jgi:hypothetical protein